MSPTKANEKSRRDLREVAAQLKCSGMDLTQVADRLLESDQGDEARELLKIAASFQALDDKPYSRHQ